MKNSIKIGCVTVLCCAAMSCTKILDKDPLSFTGTGTFWKTEADASKGLVAAYARLKEPIISNGRAQSGSFLNWEALSDNAQTTGSGYEQFDIVMQGTHTPSTAGIIPKMWEFCFKGVNACNYFLANIDRVGLPEATSQKMKGEALFLRAYYYNELAQLYGDLPIVTAPVTLNSDYMKVPRSPKTEVVEQILKDVDLAISYLPNVGYTDGRAVRGSAIMLKTRVLMNNQRFAEAATTAWTLIGDPANPFRLHTNYSGIFFNEQANNKEIMFSVQFKQPDDPHTLDLVVGSRMAVSPTVDLRNAYELNDPRRTMTLFEANQPWAYNPAGFKQAGSQAEGQIPFTGMAFKKWVNPGVIATNSTLSDQHMVKMRYADLLLLFAEAMFESGQGTDIRALNAINAVRTRPGVNMPPLLTLTRDNIRRERRIELAFEGLRYNDLIRWGVAHLIIPTIPYNAAGAKRKFKSYLFPVPLSEMDQMKGVWTQNPDWL